MLNGEYLYLRLHRLRGPEILSHRFEGLCFVFPKGGHGHHTTDSHVQSLTPGDLLILRDGAGGKISPGTGGDFVFSSFCMRPEHFFPLFDSREIALLDDVLKDFGTHKHYPSASAVAADSHRLATEVTPGPTLDHRGQLVRIAAAIFTEEFKQAHQRSGFVRAEEHVIQVFENLSSDDILNLSIQELANRFSCSRRHLNRLFHQYLGFSAASLKTEMRLLRAASLLRDPASKVITVAQKCGFNHLGLFNTTFRRRFGLSPGQWRNSGGKAEVKSPATSKPSAECSMRANGLCPWMSKAADLAPQPPVHPKGNGAANGGTNGNHSHKTSSEKPLKKPLQIEDCFPEKFLHPTDQQVIA